VSDNFVQGDVVQGDIVQGESVQGDMVQSDSVQGDVTKGSARRSASVRKKLSLSPLPAQVDQYQIEERVELRWGRIATAGALTLALIWAVWSVVRPDTQPATTELTPQIGQQPEDTRSSTRSVPDVKEPATADSQNEQLALAINQLPAPAAIAPKQPVLSAPIDTSATVVNLPDAVRATLNIRDQHVSSGYLQPVGSTFDSQDAGAIKRVALPTRGILKMELRASLTAVKGQTLYHQWLRNGKPQAKITITPTTPSHESFSSKYINQQMRGDWQARVLDASGKVLAQTDFTVY